jgi:hypothetical protein
MRETLPAFPRYTFMAWCSIIKSTEAILPLPLTSIQGAAQERSIVRPAQVRGVSAQGWRSPWKRRVQKAINFVVYFKIFCNFVNTEFELIIVDFTVARFSAASCTCTYSTKESAPFVVFNNASWASENIELLKTFCYGCLWISMGEDEAMTFIKRTKQKKDNMAERVRHVLRVHRFDFWSNNSIMEEWGSYHKLIMWYPKLTDKFNSCWYCITHKEPG